MDPNIPDDPAVGTFSFTLSHFFRVLACISRIKPTPAGKTSTSHANQTMPIYVFKQWVADLEQPSDPSQAAIVFRLLFPEEDTRRKYDMQETRLSSLLENVLGLPKSASKPYSCLSDWASESNRSVGCLGDEVRRVLHLKQATTTGCTLTLEVADSLLDELARHSPFSSLPPSASGPRPRQAILSDLFRDLTPFEAGCMTQIILKDLRPILYPLPSNNSTVNLTAYKSNSVRELALWEAMRVWDPRLLRIYRMHASVEGAFEGLGRLTNGERTEDVLRPAFGVPVEIPKCLKGESCLRTMDYYQKSGAAPRIWAETKYDGERMQIHVDMTRSKEDQIRIISKSKRNSTEDRMATHSIIQAALGLPITSVAHDDLPGRAARAAEPALPIKTSAIIEAEMVCFHEETQRIDEFWRIRSVIDGTATGARSRWKRRRISSDRERTPTDDIHEDSLQSNADDEGHRHFMLVFFDVLCVDGESIVDWTYEARRARLEQLVSPIPGFSMLAERRVIDLSGSGPVRALQSIMAERIADFEEGLVLKPGSAKYNDWTPGLRWTKMKKDYIPGLGDTLDMVIVGAGWDKDRARELRVGPETYTTFFVAAIDTSTEKHRSVRGRVHFEILFSASYGLSREQLEAFNWEIKDAGKVPYNASGQAPSYSVELTKGITSKPTILLSEPRLVELVGAGFSKSPRSKHYELRFPRITKVWDRKQRPWTMGTNLQEFHTIACAAVGRDPPRKRTSDVINRIWEIPVSPGVNCPKKRADRVREWTNRLEEVDKQVQNRKRTKTQSSSLSTPSPPKRPRKDPPTSPLAPLFNGLDRPGVLLPTGSRDDDVEKPQPMSPIAARHGVENRPYLSLKSEDRTRIPSRKSRRPSTSVPSRVLVLLPPPSATPTIIDSVVPASPRFSRPTVAPQGLSAPAGLGGVPPKDSSAEILQRRNTLELPRRIRRSRNTLPSLDSYYTPSRTETLVELPCADHVPPAISTASVASWVSTATTSSTNWSLDGSLYYIHTQGGGYDLHPVHSAKGRAQRAGTLDGLLGGLGWNAAVPTFALPTLTMGLIFTLPDDLPALVRQLTTARLALPRDACPKPLHIFHLDHIQYFYAHKLSSVSDIEPIWSSHITV